MISKDNFREFAIACETGKLQEARELFNKHNIPNKDISENLSAVCANGHLDIVQFLVEIGADIHYDDNQALRLAEAFGHFDIVDYLNKVSIEKQRMENMSTEKEYEFKVGDVVRLKENHDVIHTIERIPSKFYTSLLPDACHDTCDFIDGCWTYLSEIELVPEEKKGHTFKVGDKVRLKSCKNKHFTIDSIDEECKYNLISLSGNLGWDFDHNLELIPENELIPKEKEKENNMTFKPGDLVRWKGNHENKNVVRKVYTNQFGNICIDFENGTWGLIEHYELVPEEKKEHTFKVGDKVRLKSNKNKHYTIDSLDGENEYTLRLPNGLVGWDYEENLELVPEDPETEIEEILKKEINDSLDKSFEIRQLQTELSIVYHALEYCLDKISYLSFNHFDWQLETIKKMIELRKLNNK